LHAFSCARFFLALSGEQNEKEAIDGKTAKFVSIRVQLYQVAVHPFNGFSQRLQNRFRRHCEKKVVLALLKVKIKNNLCFCVYPRSNRLRSTCIGPQSLLSPGRQ
jgi:hypothetical protein